MYVITILIIFHHLSNYSYVLCNYFCVCAHVMMCAGCWLNDSLLELSVACSKAMITAVMLYYTFFTGA